MRKMKKNQLVKLLDTLVKASQELAEFPSDQSNANACADIQDFVSGIFEYLQSIVNQETRTEELLVSFYKQLFFVSQGQAGAEELLRLSEELLACAKEEFVTDKMEAAFFCYKASMSDCLESIYLAAKADPHCDAYFIPIPYFDRDESGNVSTVHYEGRDCYPEWWELTDWNAYDVEKRHPDVIFIMNPYDGNNRVTSVHPDYYARRLRNFTDLLIYVPYLVHSEVISKEMAMTPGVFFSHRTIVQSEHVREQYIEGACACFTETARSEWERRIIALGSPKVDRVVLAKKEEQPVPETWKPLLQNRIGKKIILYNLSLETAMSVSRGETPMAYLNKLRSVFHFFEERQDVLLWWRPHPLLAQTFSCISRELYEGYQTLVQEYQKAGTGIYDDTSDMARAIAFADACYGDESSLNLLMQLVGKPVLVQNIRNAGNEPHVPESRAHMEQLMQEFIAKEHYNSYILYEWMDAAKGSLIDFIEHLDVIERYREQQSGKYRARYANADGTAGQKIYEYVKEILQEGID